MKTRALSAAALALVLAAGLSCKSNHPPDAPAVPTGPVYCLKDTAYTFKTTATDPDEDSVAVRFDWGDSSTAYWHGWFPSGEEVALTHAWSDTGTFRVRAWAQDRRLFTSDSSGGLMVRVALRRPPSTPSEPVGPDVGSQDSVYTFTTAASHPDGITVAIRFAWGDGDTSNWSPFVVSGAPRAMSHAWSAPGTFAVTAQAKDTGGVSSLWSSPHTIIIRAPDTLLKWRVQLRAGEEGDLYSSPAIGPDGTIYVGSSDSSLYAVYGDGTLEWRFLTGGWIRSSPAIAPDGTIYVGSHDSSLYAINPDGTLKWRCSTGGYVRSSPAIAADGTVYLGSSDDRVYAFCPEGTPKWSYLTRSSISSSPAIAADGTIYVGSWDENIYALNPDGTLKWSYHVGGNVSSSPAVAADGTIYVGSDDMRTANVYALNPNGTLKWGYLVSDDVRSSPIIAADGTVYIGSYDRSFYAFTADGTLKWSYQTAGHFKYASAAVAADGTVYFGSHGDNLYALYPDGNLKWSYETGGNIESSPSIGSDGTVYFTSNDGYLYALKGTSPLASSPWPKFHHDLRNTGRASGVPGRIGMVGVPELSTDSTGFRIEVVNTGMEDVTVQWLEFRGTSEPAYMRNFMIDGEFGQDFPKGPGALGAGPGDTVRFLSPVTIAANMSELVEVIFSDFYDNPLGTGDKINVHGKVFRFRFDDGSDVTVNP